MANVQNTGLSQFQQIPDIDSTLNGTDGAFDNLENQTDLYLKGVLDNPEFVNEFDNTKLGSSKISNPSINNQTDQKKFFQSGGTYLDFLNAEGSDILLVNGTQVGNEEDAQTSDYSKYDKYFERGK